MKKLIAALKRADDKEIGGQLNYAKQVPGKEEFWGFVRWFGSMLAASRVDLRLDTPATPENLATFDEVIIATGVRPRDPGIVGEDGGNVLSYIEVLTGAPVGKRVAIVGAGGIGFDVAEFVSQNARQFRECHSMFSPSLDNRTRQRSLRRRV